MIEQLFEYYAEHTEVLPRIFKEALENSDDEKEQIICDYIAGMTDSYAVKKECSTVIILCCGNGGNGDAAVNRL